ncbi:MAG: guanine deaminase [Clostridiales bacterium]|nr:guanine deaminase [Clostridiales bacterium]
MDKIFLRKTIDLAMESRKSDNEPFGAVLVKENEIDMIGRNEINSRCGDWFIESVL